MLTVIRTKRKTRRFLVYDLEWVPGTLQVRIVGVYDGNSYRCYRTVDDFLNSEMTHENRGAWFYAHAGGLADVQFVFETIISKGANNYDINASFSGSSAIIAHVRRKRGKNAWHFVDSYWLFRDSLASIARSIGRKKTGPKALDGATQAEIKEWYASAPLSELIPYNQNDCEILWHAIDQFENRVLEMGGQLQMTIASSAMHLFRRKYLKKDIGTNELINEVGRKAYFASRVEVFHENCDDALYFDINSSFPYAMTKPVPGEFHKSTKRLPNDQDRYLYLADVSFTIPDSYLPPIPTRVDGRLFFPVGSWRSWLTGIDVELLQREGGSIDKVHEVMTFEPMSDLRDYALDLYEQRKKASDPFDKLVLKYYLNSLYGKFAERPEKERMLVFPDLKAMERLKRSFAPEELADMTLMPGVYVEPVLVNVQHEHVPIAAYITARARQTLYDFMSQSRDCYYCDTDGFATTDMYDTGSELGALKLEKKIVSGSFVAPKVYRLDGEVLQDDGSWNTKTIVKAKGFSLGKGPESVTRFETLVDGKEVEVERMARIRENFSRGQIRPREAVIKKRFRDRLITKRFHYPDGHTRPWHIKELEK